VTGASASRRLTAARQIWSRMARRLASGWLFEQGPDAQVTSAPPGGPAVVAEGIGGATPGRVDAHSIVAQAYESYQREIHAFALHATRDQDAAADVMQEAFLRLTREVKERAVPDNVRAWLYRVASNLVVNRARQVSVADRWRRIIAGPERFVESPERSLLDHERDAAVQSALAGMSKDSRTGLLLAANGFSGREIAEALGRTENATRTLLCRARMQLRDRLEPFEAEA
jgi:RNA polymerase sigma-70 factor (ECF subfamily)